MITFCENNPFSTKHSQTFMESVARENGVQNISYRSLYNMGHILLLTQLKASSSNTSETLRKSLGLNISQINCSYNEADCMDYLHWYWSIEYGNCYQFNSGFNWTNQKIDLKSTYRHGKEFGVFIQVYLNNMNKHVILPGSGLIVFIHNSSFRPTNGVFIKVGEMTHIQVERTFIQKQPSPYSNCIDLTSYSSELFDYIVNSNQTYRQADCFELCLQQLILKNCEFFYHGYQNLNTHLRPCMNVTDVDCMSKQYLNFRSDECQANSCPLECDTIKYDFTLSSLAFPSQNFYEKYFNTQEYRDYLKSTFDETLSINYMRENSLFFNVYYPNLQYTLLTESPKTTVADLFSQIGGALGMFVSFSVFTLFEFIEIFILLLYNIFHSK